MAEPLAHGLQQTRHIALGRMNYDEALKIQQNRADQLLRMADEYQTLYTVEHPPTITLGRNASPGNIIATDDELARIGMVVREVDRGGDVTYHGPGQLVVYPVLHLGPWDNDVGRYVRMLEEVVIAALAEVGIVGTRDAAYPGVWISNRKVCAVGCRVRRRPTGEFVAHHGIALNVSTDLSHFETIIPCGIQNRGVTSIVREAGQDASGASLPLWEARILRQFARIFCMTLESVAM